MTSIFTENVTLPQAFFKHFASKNQLPGFYVSETLVENGLTSLILKAKFSDGPKVRFSSSHNLVASFFEVSVKYIA